MPGHALTPTLAATYVAVAATLASCFRIPIPLPDEGPELQYRQPIAIGMTRQEVRDALGKPGLLDTPRAMVYEWDAERTLNIVAAPFYPGVAAIPQTGQSYRMLVTFADADRVTDIRCTWIVPTPGPGVGPGADDIVPCRINSSELTIGPELIREISLPHPPGDGSYSADGRYFAFDSYEQARVFDLQSGSESLLRIGVPLKQGILEPSVFFSTASDSIVVSQPDAGVQVYRLQEGVWGQTASMMDSTLELAAFTSAGTNVIAYADGELRRYSLELQLRGSVPVEGELEFDAHGARRSRKVEDISRGFGVWVEQGVLSPGIAVFLSPVPADSAILDRRMSVTRRSFALNFRLSPDGTYLARNTCRHLELWQTSDLRALLAGTAGKPVSPALTVLLPIVNPKELEDSSGAMFGVKLCRAGIAFSADGAFVAAASESAVNVWRISDGQQVALVIPPMEPAGRVQSIGFNASGHLLVNVADRIQVWALSGADR